MFLSVQEILGPDLLKGDIIFDIDKIFPFGSVHDILQVEKALQNKPRPKEVEVKIQKAEEDKNKKVCFKVIYTTGVYIALFEQPA